MPTYRIHKLDPETNKWLTTGFTGDQYHPLNALVHTLEQTGDVYAIMHQTTGAWV